MASKNTENYRKQKFEKVMHEFKHKQLKSFHGPMVTKRSQALAIAFEESGTGK